MKTTLRNRLVTLYGSLSMLAMLLMQTSSAHAQVWDVAAQFDPVNNPAADSPWRYGYTAGLGGSFSLLTYHTAVTTTDQEYWEKANTNYPYNYPVVHFNPTSTTLYFYNGGDPNNGVNGSIAPGQLAVEPGPNGEVVTTRWIAPYAGTFKVEGTFAALQQQGLRGPSVNVHILENNSSLWDSGIYSGYGSTGYTTTLTLNQGDIIDFGVDYGNNHNIDSDITGISAHITSVPEPTAFVWAGAILLTGAGTLVRAIGRRSLKH